MAICPACGIEVAAERSDCPRCHLATALFEPVRDAAGPTGADDPAYLRTIGELLATVELDRSAELPEPPAARLLGRPDPRTALDVPDASALRAARPAPALPAVLDLPAVPTPGPDYADLAQRVREYFELGRRLGLDFTDFHGRANSAALVRDTDSLEILAREMFVHLSSSIAEEYESCLARRNELAQLLPTPSADVALTAVRRAIGVGDLAGAQRRLALARDELRAFEEEWQVDRILVTEGELLLATIRELGGDPGPAAGPLEEGRRLFAQGRRAESEAVLARATVALWTVLEPRLLAELKRLRDRMAEQRSAGLDIRPAVKELRGMSAELRRRNFVGMVVAYRRLRSTVERTSPSGVEGLEGAALLPEARPVPPA
jgi:hypothetical protein